MFWKFMALVFLLTAIISEFTETEIVSVLYIIATLLAIIIDNLNRIREKLPHAK